MPLLLHVIVEAFLNALRAYLTRNPFASVVAQNAVLLYQLHQTWAIDFTTQVTLFFRTFYIFAVMELHTRRIVLWNFTDHPTLEWIKIQIREAVDRAGKAPRFLIHDLDGRFGPSSVITNPATGRRKTYRTTLDRWLPDVLQVSGLPVSLAVMNPYVERFWLSLESECLDHFLFLSEDHLRRTLAEYIAYYHGARFHQGLHAIPDPMPELRSPPPKNGKLVAIPVLGGLIHDYRLVA
jgi:putative transposase